jgi:hypothetical protein
MSSETEDKWGYRVEMTLGEMFDPHWELPHKGILEIERELEKTMGREKALELITSVSKRLILQQVKEMLRESPVESFEDFISLFDQTSDDLLWDKVNIDEYKKISENVRETKTIACLYADTWRKWGAPEVGYAWHCAGDFVLIEAIHPNLRLERPKSLMMGDDCCNFKMIWEEKE